MKPQLITTTLGVLLLSLWMSGAAQATLNVTVLDTTLSVGGTGTLTVEISGTGDLVAFSSLELRITPSVGNSGGTGLQFLDPNTADYASNPNYLFAPNSFNLINSIDVSSVSSTSLPGDTFADNDSDNDFGNQTVTGTFLLAGISLFHSLPIGTDPSSVLGDEFDISVIGTGGIAGTGDPFDNTNFLDDLGNSIVYTSSSGRAQFQATAVPEPSSVLLLTLGMGAAAWQRRRRMRA